MHLLGTFFVELMCGKEAKNLPPNLIAVTSFLQKCVPGYFIEATLVLDCACIVTYISTKQQLNRTHLLVGLH